MGGNYFFSWDGTHEIFGVSLFILWALHIIANRHWYESIFRGRYRAFRVMQVCVNSFILICAIFLMLSGIMLSNHVFVFLNINIGSHFARTAHLLASHWYFIAMSLHIGLHIEAISRGMQKTSKKVKHPFTTILVRLLLLTFICGYGVYAFIQHNLWKYLFLQEQFFFLKIERGYTFFFIDHIAIITLFATIAHYLGTFCKKRHNKNLTH